VGSWAGVVWLDQRYSNLLVSLARMRRQPSRVVDVVAAYGLRGDEHPPAALFLAVCLVCPPQSSKGSCMRYVRQGEGRRCRDRSLVVAPMPWLHISLLAHLDYLTVRLSVLLKRAPQRSVLMPPPSGGIFGCRGGSLVVRTTANSNDTPGSWPGLAEERVRLAILASAVTTLSR
jgi:hypothetical protein